MTSSAALVSAWILLGLLLVALCGLIDYYTGPHISFSLFYLIPISLVSWRTGLGAGLFVSVASGLAWWFVEHLGGIEYASPLIPCWNALVRLGFFVTVTALIASLSASRTKLESEVAARTLELRKEIAEKLRIEEMRLQWASIVESSSDAIIGVTLEGNICSWNKGATRLYGYSAEEAQGRPLVMLYPPECAGEYSQFRERIRRGEQVENCESQRITKDGRRLGVSVTISPIRDKTDAIVGLSSIARDITEKKRVEERITASLKEKEVLLREIHHRVKNNLQIICSLLHLHSDLIRDDKALEVFRDAEARVRSMALIHERLYRSEDLTLIRFDDYVRSLLGVMLPSLGPRAGTVRFVTDLQPLSFGMELAVPLGLILNELVSNSISHGLADARDGVVTVEMYREGGGYLTLRVCDNGVGLPQDFVFETTTSLGLRLVKLLTEQIGGRLIFGGKLGAEFKVTFPEVGHLKGKG